MEELRETAPEAGGIGRSTFFDQLHSPQAWLMTQGEYWRREGTGGRTNDEYWDENWPVWIVHVEGTWWDVPSGGIGPPEGPRQGGYGVAVINAKTGGDFSLNWSTQPFEFIDRLDG